MKSFNEFKEDLSWKAAEAGYRIKKGAKTLAKTCWDNKEVLMVIAPAAIAGAKGVQKIGHDISRNHAIKVEQHYKDTHTYDHSLGQYVELRRKMSGSEIAEMERRMKNGMKKSEALQSMGLLK